MNIHILYPKYLRDDRTTAYIGGIQTYIFALAKMLIKNDYNVTIHQQSSDPFSVVVDSIPVIGHVCRSKFSETVLKEIDTKDLVIFASDDLSVPTTHKSIAIQHGITWDKPSKRNSSRWINRLFITKRAYQSLLRIKKISYVNTLVCVDYNFINWYKTQLGYPEVDCLVIPNFTSIPQNNSIKHDIGSINIVFARRLFEYRGTRIFANAISKILDNYPNVHVTVAGEGPDKEWMKNKLENYKQVEFVTYSADESLEMHKDKHIAVVPTIGSEGTSLSLLEAMASSCAVVCTNVGGMTNIVIDGYNGLMINPKEAALYDALEKLVINKELRRCLSERAYDTVKNAFSYEKWTEKWKCVIEDFRYD